MATAISLLTLADLERMPDDGMHRELVDGELIELPPPKSLHVLMAHRIQKILERLLPSDLRLAVFIEAGYKARRDERTWIEPDVSVVSHDMIRMTDEDGYFEGSPMLAVEVISPSERAQDVHRKAELTIAGGAVEVWIVYPKLKQVVVYSSNRTDQRLSTGDTLVSGLGFSVPVAQIVEP